MAAVRAAVEAVRSGSLSVADLYAHVLTPLLVDTGAGWQRGTTRVWEEHFASATVRTIIESLYLDVARIAEESPRRGETVVLAAPAQEAHDLGLRMLADRLTLVGWDVIFLGADTPTSDIIAAARTTGASLVVLSVATHFNRLQLRSVVDRLKAELPDARIGVGGPGFAHDRSWPADELLSPTDLGLSVGEGV